jgi:hypothetical protein
MKTTAMLTLSIVCKKCSLVTQYVGNYMKTPSLSEARREGWWRTAECKGGEYAEIWLCPTCHGDYDRLLSVPRAARAVAFAEHDAKWKEVLMQAQKERFALFADPVLNGPSVAEWVGGGE